MKVASNMNAAETAHIADQRSRIEGVADVQLAHSADPLKLRTVMTSFTNGG